MITIASSMIIIAFTVLVSAKEMVKAFIESVRVSLRDLGHGFLVASFREFTCISFFRPALRKLLDACARNLNMVKLFHVYAAVNGLEHAAKEMAFS